MDCTPPIIEAQEIAKNPNEPLVRNLCRLTKLEPFIYVTKKSKTLYNLYVIFLNLRFHMITHINRQRWNLRRMMELLDFTQICIALEKCVFLF